MLTQITSDRFPELYSGSWYTIIGCGGDLDKWVEGYTEDLDKFNIGKPKEFVTFYGKDMNKHYGLLTSNAYQDNLVFLAFPLDDLDVSQLAMFKLLMSDHWFDDIVDNNARHQSEIA